MKKSIFFISKPLELLGAIEAREQFKLSDCILVIKSDKYDDATINFLIEKSGGWNSIIRTKKKSSYGFSWLKLVKELKKEDYQYLFVRAFPIASYFVNNLNYEKCYLLDDGAATIEIARNSKFDGYLTKRFSLFKGKNKKGGKYTLVEKIYKAYGISIENEVNNINFFSYYNLEDLEPDNVVKNEFKWLKIIKKDSKEQEEDSVYLLGTNVVNANLLSFKDYFMTLNKICDFYKGKKIIYIPHPREKEGDLKKIELELSFVIKKNKLNVELDFILNNEVPKHIAGTITSALITLKMIFNQATVDFFNLDDEKVDKERQKVIKEIYKYQDKYIDYHKLNY
ncbi:hypothetical protein C8N26_1581 [Tenacibaculum lutimaris]|uniref:Uncharacterized protein n=1 Tax=Tenacibaculum lutimaris TaxID=285258 RepID=A0A420E1J7_9FLAO|nr:hypothetical protein [Tenacibaculum lutimaris]RKF03949.1 hypothetical protein C8N26_1581 [Tenacibaculum lutimaris]